MEKWDIFLCLSALITTAALIVKPVLKLNTSIVKLNSSIDKLSLDVEELKLKNSKNHEKLWNYCFMQDELINDHEDRLNELEKNM